MLLVLGLTPAKANHEQNFFWHTDSVRESTLRRELSLGARLTNTSKAHGGWPTKPSRQSNHLGSETITM